MLGAITILAAVLRFHLLGAHSLWIDEAASVRFATLAWKPFLRTLWTYQGNMTLYYFLLRAWIHLGDSEFMVRSLSVLFGVLTIPAMYALGKRLFDRATGLTASALLSVHSFHILWSQQARGYSLLLLLLVLTFYSLVCAMESHDNTAYWVVFAILAALSVYAHIFAVLALAAPVLSILFPKPYRVTTRNIVVSALLFEALIAPMAIFVVLQHSSQQINWVPRPSWAEFWGFVQLLTSQGGVVLAVVYLALGGLAFLFPAGSVRSDKESWALRLLGLWLVLPPLMTLAASPIKLLFDPKFMVMCVPALVMLAARGLVKLSNVPPVRYWAAAAAFLLVVSLSYLSIAKPPKYQTMVSADWRSSIHYVLAHQQPADGAVFYIPNDYPFLYYAHQAISQHQVSDVPDVVYPPDPPNLPLSREAIRSVTAGRQRVWLILHDEEDFDPEAEPMVKSALNEKFVLQDERVFSGEAYPVTVELYSRKP